MGRPPRGHVYSDHGARFVTFRIEEKPKTFRLVHAATDGEAEEARRVMLDALLRLRNLGKEAQAEAFLGQLAASDRRRRTGVLTILEGVLRGTEHAEPPEEEAAAAPKTPTRPKRAVTFGEFADRWTSGELAADFRGRIKVIDHTENKRRLRVHVLDVSYRGQRIAEVPLDEFTLDHAEHILRQKSLPSGSLRHVAQILNRIFRLAVYPARLIAQSPFPRGWLPPANPVKARSYMLPEEDLLVLRCAEIPLVKRLYIGMANREGTRRGNLVNLEWSCLVLNVAGGGFLSFDETKNGEDANWALDPGTAEALRRWRKLCPSKRWVFPELAVPTTRTLPRLDRPMYVNHLSEDLREWLQECGVDRPKLYERTEDRLPLRAHDLRATFVTLALANGRTETWVMQRTGHKTYGMLARYRRDARTLEELRVGWLAPLHEAIPELAKLTQNTTDEQ
ncbi:MAG: tyrosine-type recombinase/integrase [Polyangiaceae bacterium]|nr:tyrosine-type recombinase/integrase [Polyangiaceae bacterium]